MYLHGSHQWINKNRVNTLHQMTRMFFDFTAPKGLKIDENNTKKNWWFSNFISFPVTNTRTQNTTVHELHFKEVQIYTTLLTVC